MERIIIILFVVGSILFGLVESGLLIPIFVAIGAVGCGIFVHHKMAEEKEYNVQRQLEEARRRKAKQDEATRRDKVAHQQATSLNSLVDQADQAMSSIPKHLEKSEAAISLAGEKYKNRSFYPFWDCVAAAVESLLDYKNAIKHLDKLRGKYISDLSKHKSVSDSKYNHTIKRFPANSDAVTALRIGSETASRIDKLYEIAHTDFEFSNIYANWRTNNTLVAGFENLSTGLELIHGELEHINFTLIDGFDSVTSAVQDSTDRIVGSINGLTKTVERHGDEFASYRLQNEFGGSGNYAQSEKQDEMIKLLKNIQHNREDIPMITDIAYYAETRPKK